MSKRLVTSLALLGLLLCSSLLAQSIIKNQSQDFTSKSVEKSNTTFSFDGVNALLWDNFLTQSTTCIVAGEWGGLPAGANQVIDAEDFFVPSAATWTIDQIAATGLYSVGEAQTWGVSFYADNEGTPGTLIQTVTVPVTVGDPNPAGFLSSTVVLTGEAQYTRYWISIYGIHPTATTLAEFRWNWYTSEDPEIFSEPYLRDDAGFFGGTPGWVTYTSLGLPEFNALMFQLYGTATGGCPVGLATNPYPVDGSINISTLFPGNIEWTNGANTTQVEVFFGPAGNMVSVYNGAPITSYPIPGPLETSTTYQWKVRCFNDTCSGGLVETWSFTTEYSPYYLFGDEFNNFVQWTVVGPLGIGSWGTIPTSLADGVAPELRMAWTPSFNGESRIRSRVINAPNSADFSFRFNWFFDWYADPSGTIGLAATYDGGVTTVPLWSVVDPTSNIGPEQIYFNFTTPSTGSSNLQFELYFIGNSFNNDNIYWDNMLLVGSIPVELTSFAAVTDNKNVTLNWSTATELNNSGFQVERSNGSEYQSVGFIAGHGTTTEIQNYSFVDQNVVGGKYSYRLKQIDFNGAFEYSNVVEVEVLGVKVYALGQNYPNPFNPSTTINFSLAVDSKVSLKIFDVLGQEVATLVNGQLAAGNQIVSFNASSLNSGVYFYRIDANGNDGQKFSSTRKMILTK